MPPLHSLLLALATLLLLLLHPKGAGGQVADDGRCGAGVALGDDYGVGGSSNGGAAYVFGGGAYVFGGGAYVSGAAARYGRGAAALLAVVAAAL